MPEENEGKLNSELMKGFVHECRSLLGAVDGYGRLALLQMDTDSNKAKNYLSKQQESIIHLSDHISKVSKVMMSFLQGETEIRDEIPEES